MQVKVIIISKENKYFSDRQIGMYWPLEKLSNLRKSRKQNIKLEIFKYSKAIKMTKIERCG